VFSYIDKATRTEKRISARAIVVAASACESASAAELQISGLSGRASPTLPGPSADISPTPSAAVVLATFRNWRRCRRTITDGVGGMHMYMPWWKFDRKNDFPAAITSR